MSHDTLQRVIGVAQLASGIAGIVYGGGYGAGSGGGNMAGMGVANIQGKDTEDWWHRKGGFGQDAMSGLGYGIGKMNKNYDPNTPQNKYGAIGETVGGLLGGLSGGLSGGGGAGGAEGGGESFTGGSNTLFPGGKPYDLGGSTDLVTVVQGGQNAPGSWGSGAGMGGGSGGLGSLLGGMGGGQGGGMGGLGGLTSKGGGGGQGGSGTGGLASLMQNPMVMQAFQGMMSKQQQAPQQPVAPAQMPGMAPMQGPPAPEMAMNIPPPRQIPQQESQMAIDKSPLPFKQMSPQVISILEQLQGRSNGYS